MVCSCSWELAGFCYVGVYLGVGRRKYVFHVLLLLPSIFFGVGGAICVILWVMLRLLHIFFIVSICYVILILLFW